MRHMAQFKHFEAAKTSEEDELYFTVGGDDYRYYPLKVLPAMFMIELLAGETNRQAMRGSVEFLDQVLPEEQAKHFADRLRSKDNPITMEQLGNVVSWLVEVYTGRPTE